MRVLFVYPTPDRSQVYHQGIGYLSAVLKEHGHQTALLLLPARDRQAVSAAVRSFEPHLVCLTSATNQIPLSAEVARLVYESTRLPVVLGGVHSSFEPEECLALPGVMAVCLGEGEHPLLELAQALEDGRAFTAIPNLWFSGGHAYRWQADDRSVPGDGIIRNEVRPPVADLDALPFPDRDLFRAWSGAEERFDFMASRGCPFSCAYCFHRRYRTLFPPGHAYCRHRSVGHVIEEIERVRSSFPSLGRVNFHDDTFNLSAPWLREFARVYRARIGLPFECSLQAHLADEETVALLAEAGCSHVFVGVETGDEGLRRTVLNKKVTNEELLRVFGWARKHGLRTTAHYMLGIPFETEETLRASIELARRLAPDCFSPTIFYPFPGTDLRALCLERSWLSGRSAASYYYGSVLDQPSISHAAVERYRLLFPRLLRHDLLFRICRPRPVAFLAGNALRSLRRVKQATRSARLRARRPRPAGR